MFSEVPVLDILAHIGNAQNVDAWLVLYPALGSEEVGYDSVKLRGLGLYKGALFRYIGSDWAQPTAAYAIYNVALVDARTNKLIAEYRASPHVLCDAHAWPDQVVGMNEQQRAALRSVLKLLIEASLTWALHSVGLIEARDDPVAPSCTIASATPAK